MKESIDILLKQIESNDIDSKNMYTEDINVGGSGTLEFGDDINTSETSKQKLKRYYNEIAIEKGYSDIEQFYVRKKFELALKGDKYSKADDYMSNLLKTIASDMGYTQHNKEFFMNNNLPSTSGSDLIGK